MGFQGSVKQEILGAEPKRARETNEGESKHQEKCRKTRRLRADPGEPLFQQVAASHLNAA